MLQIANNLNLPVELAGRRTAVFGISGSGKSNTATVLIEQLFNAGEQVVMIDPKGEGWGLLSLANGKKSSLPIVIFGEPNGHIMPLNENHGTKIADFVVDSGRSVVLSMVGFESDQSERRFVATFLRQLYRRKSQASKQTRTLVVMEEAHLFVPEHAQGAATELAGAVQRIARQGRTFGLGTLVVDQRPQDVSKRVITQCDTIICHQLTHKLDRKALQEWVDGYDTDNRGKEFMESLASLQPGEAWVWSPAAKIFQKVKVNRRKTFDSGASPDGKTSRTLQREEVDLDTLRGQLDEVVEHAKSSDPKELKKTIADLQKQLTSRPAAAPVSDRYVEGRTDGYNQATKDIIHMLREPWSKADLIRGYAETLTKVLGDLVNKPTTSSAPPPRKGVERQAIDAVNSFAASRTPPPPPAPAGTDRLSAKYGKGEEKTLIAVAQTSGGATREQITRLTGYKRSTRDTYIQRLKQIGYVVDENAMIIATQEGITRLGDAYQSLPTGDALLQHWLGKLPEGEAKILRFVCSRQKEPTPRDDISEETGFQRSTRDTYIQRLCARRLLRVVGAGKVIGSDDLFD